MCPNLFACLEVAERMKGLNGLLWISKGSPTNLVVEVVGQKRAYMGLSRLVIFPTLFACVVVEGRMKGLNEQYASSLLELSIFTIYLMKGLPASQFKVKVNIFVIVLILQLRSATVVIAYLMMKQNMTCKQVTISSTCLISVMITL